MKASRAALKQEFGHGGWRIVLGSAFGYAMGVTVLPFYTLGVFVLPLEESFGWSRGQIQSCLIFLVAATLVGGWGIGWLTDRYGTRIVAATSQVGLAVGLALLGTMTGALWFWYAAWFLMTLVGLGTTPITWTRSIAGHFNRTRGLALALALSGSGVSALLAPVLTTALIAESGWRIAYFTLAGIVLFIAVPITLFVLPRPKARAPAGQGIQAAKGQEHSGITLREAARHRQFWLLTACVVFLGFAITGPIPNLVPMMVDRGMAPANAASLMGVLGISVIVGRLGTGIAIDRFWAPAVACVVLPLPAVSCLVLAGGTSDYLTVAACAVLLGISTGAEFDLAAYLVAKYFGMKNYAQIYSVQFTGFTVASGFAPGIFGFYFDLTGSYAGPLYVAAALFVISPLLLLFFGRYPSFERKTASAAA